MAQLLKYVETRAKLPKQPCPSHRNVWLVYQDSFAYLDQKQPTRKVLASSAQAVCIEVYLRHKNGAGMLTHLSPRSDQFVRLTDIVAYLIKEGVAPTAEYPKAIILTNFFSSRTAIRRAFYTLKLMGMQPEVLRCLPPLRNDVLIDNDGNMYRTNITQGFCGRGVPDEMQKEIGLEIMGVTGTLLKDAFVRGERALVCINTREEVVRQPAFDIYPSVPFLDIRDWRDNGHKKRFVIRFPVVETFDPDALSNVLSTVPRLEGVTARLDKCKHGKYVTVGTQQQEHLNWQYARHVETTAMNILACIT